VVAEGLIEFLNDEFNAGLPKLDMYSILNEGGWNAVSPAALCGACNAKEAVLTRDAFMQLYEMMLPELAARWQQPKIDRQQHASSTN